MLRLSCACGACQLQICFLEAVHSYHSNILGAITCVMPGTVNKEVPVDLDDILEKIMAVS